MTPDGLLDLLVKCLDREITKARTDDVCFVGVIPGEAPVHDYAGECKGGKRGMAWVRSTLMYPADGINKINEQVNNCGSSIGMDIELGMLRPVVIVSDARGNPPTPDQYRAAAAEQNQDAMTMLRAVRCCMPETDIDYILGVNSPFGPLGGLVGSTWAMAVTLD